MNDKQYELLQKRIQKVLDKWMPILGLDKERIRFKYIREFNTDKYTVAQCYPLWQYKSHTIEFFMPSVNEATEDELEEDIVHELCHILIAPATGNDPPADRPTLEQHELATQNVAFALVDAYNKGKTAK